jgi:anti-sigma B factor antagonist
MNFQTTEHGQSAVIKSYVSKLDATNSPDLKEQLISLNKKGINNIVLDLTESKYCDSMGLSAILIGNRLCKDTNGVFILCGLQPNVMKLIQISQLDKVLKIQETEVDALKVLEV